MNDLFLFYLPLQKKTNPELIGVLESESAKNVHLFNSLKPCVVYLNPLKT